MTIDELNELLRQKQESLAWNQKCVKRLEFEIHAIEMEFKFHKKELLKKERENKNENK